MKKHWLSVSFLFLMLWIGTASTGLAQAGVSPEAEKIVREMCDYLKSKAQFSYRADVAFDNVGDNGGKLTHSFKGKAFVRRPDRLRVDAAGKEINKDFFFDGKTITLYDKTEKVYGVLDETSDIEGALEKAHKDFDLRVALADLASPKLGELLLGKLHGSKYLGKGKVRGVACHHLELSNEDVQVQLWVDAGKDPLLRKVIIVRKDNNEATHWTADFTDWDFTSELKDDIFTFMVPKDAQKIKFVPAEKGAKQ